jgi:hypothetical protein
VVVVVVVVVVAVVVAHGHTTMGTEKPSRIQKIRSKFRQKARGKQGV